MTWKPGGNGRPPVPTASVGAYLGQADMGASDFPAAHSIWQGLGLPPLRSVRIYLGDHHQWDPMPIRLVTAINEGMKIALSIRPPCNPVSQLERDKLDAFLATCRDLGAEMDVAMWHEPYYRGVTAAQFRAMYEFYAPTIRNYYPVWCCFSGPDANPANGYFPGDAYVDGIAVDSYCSSWLNNRPADEIARAQSMADAHGLSFAIWEFNGAIDPVCGQSQSDVTDFFNHIKNLFLTRLARGKPCGDILLFNSSGESGVFNRLGTGLTQNAGFEGGIGSWTAAGNSSVAPSTAYAHSGSGALAMTCTTAGNISAASCTAANIVTQGMAVTPGKAAFGQLWLRPGSTARSVGAALELFNSSGKSMTTVYGAAATQQPGEWVQATVITNPVPARAAHARLRASVQSAAVNEMHYVDDACLSEVLSSGDRCSPIAFSWDYRIELYQMLVDTFLEDGPHLASLRRRGGAPGT